MEVCTIISNALTNYRNSIKTDSFIIYKLQQNDFVTVIVIPICRDQSNGAVIARSGQPQVAFLGYRCDEDESLIRAIAESSTGGQVNDDEVRFNIT